MKIRSRTYASGVTVWQLDLGVVEGKRVQKSYAKEADAVKAMKAAENAHARHGALASSMSGKEMAEIVLARERLHDAGATISQAVEFFFKHAQVMTRPVMLDELVKRFRDAKEGTGRSTRYFRQLGVSLNSLARHLPGVHAHDVSRKDVEAWLNSGGWSARTKNGYAGDVSAMFAWAVKEGYAKLNPAADIERMKMAQGV